MQEIREAGETLHRRGRHKLLSCKYEQRVVAIRLSHYTLESLIIFSEVGEGGGSGRGEARWRKEGRGGLSLRYPEQNQTYSAQSRGAGIKIVMDLPFPW